MGQVRGIVRVIPVVLVVLLPDCRPHNCAMASCPCRRLWKAPRVSSHLGLGARAPARRRWGAALAGWHPACWPGEFAQCFSVRSCAAAQLVSRRGASAPGRLCTDGVPSRCPGSHRLPIRCRPLLPHTTQQLARARVRRSIGAAERSTQGRDPLSHPSADRRALDTRHRRVACWHGSVRGRTLLILPRLSHLSLSSNFKHGLRKG